MALRKVRLAITITYYSPQVGKHTASCLFACFNCTATSQLHCHCSAGVACLNPRSTHIYQLCSQQLRTVAPNGTAMPCCSTTSALKITTGVHLNPTTAMSLPVLWTPSTTPSTTAALWTGLVLCPPQQQLQTPPRQQLLQRPCEHLVAQRP